MAQSTNVSKISTLIFMDLETTGLACDVGKKNVQITEMSFVAIDRKNFEDDKNLRVLNKLSLCIRPRSVISPGAMSITGLYNDILENQEEFDDSVPKLLEYFFRRLQPPICLLAHNGKRFDFPVLQSELQRINYALDSHILCADTLIAFRSICLSPKPVKMPGPPNEDKVTDKPVESTNNGHMSEDEIDILLSQDLESFTHITCMTDETMLFKAEIQKTTPVIHTLLLPEKQESEPLTEFLDPKQNEKTPTNRKIPSNLNAGVMNIKKRKILDPPFHPRSECQRNIQPVKRALFSEINPLPHKITKFTLESLYAYFFGENPPISHYAEMDCISLSKVCQKINRDFLEWIDENSEAFCNVGTLW